MEVDQSSQDSSVVEMNNGESVLHKIANMYAEQLMSDICLVVGDQRYPAHRVILCASSEVFQVMLMNPEWSESCKNVIELKEEPCCSAVFPQFLKYLYCGQVRISLQTVMPMLALADKYNIKDLVELCVDYMMKHVAKAATQGFLVSWLQYTIAFSPYHQELTEALKRFLKWNLQIVADSKDFGDLDTSIMILLLQQNDLVVKNEYELFGFLEKWLTYRKEQVEAEPMTKERKEEMFGKLMEDTVSKIRFAMMTPREMASLVLNPVLANHKRFLVDRIAIGMNYHAAKYEIIENIRSDPNETLQFTPRLYTSDIWSLSIFVEEFDKVEKYKNFVACFFSQRRLEKESVEQRFDMSMDQCFTWELEFFPRGVKYNKAKMVLGEEIPEFILRTVRLRVTCKEYFETEERFKVAVLITGCEHQISHILTVHERTEYFSDSFRVLNMDDLIPYEELALTSRKLSPHLIGSDRNNLNIQVIIAPMGPYTNHETPSLDLLN